MVKESKQKVKKIRGLNEPKKPTTEYFMFLRDERKKLRPGLSVKEQTQILSKMWADLDKEKKAKYSEEYKLALEKYKKEMLEYKETDEHKEIALKNATLKKNSAKETGKKKVVRKPSGYNLFVKEKREEMAGSKDGPAPSFKEISQIISKKWHGLSQGEKDKYNTKAKESSEKDDSAENVVPSK